MPGEVYDRDLDKLTVFRNDLINSSVTDLRLRAAANYILDRERRLIIIGEVAHRRGETELTSEVSKMIAKNRRRRFNGTE